MWVNGEYTNGVSVMDRIRARAYEALKIASAMQDWLGELAVGAAVYTPWTTPTTATASGLTEAPRGALGHWIGITGGEDLALPGHHADLLDVSPRDGAGQLGPLEQALMGTPVANANEPVEVLRVIHSVDPCLDCATHVMRAKKTDSSG